MLFSHQAARCVAIVVLEQLVTRSVYTSCFGNSMANLESHPYLEPHQGTKKVLDKERS